MQGAFALGSSALSLSATRGFLCSRRPRGSSAFVPTISARMVPFSAHAAGSSGEALDKSTPASTWKTLLSAQEYHVLRDKGTERPGSSA